HAQGWWQVLDIGQLAIQAAAETFYAHFMAERCGSQQFYTDLVGHHVDEVQAQLGVAVQSCSGAADGGAIEAELATILTRINSDRAGADNDVTGLVGLGDGSRLQSGNKQQAGGESGYSA